MSVPLAERIRPKTLDDIVGQTHLLGENKPLRRIIESGKIPNMIFYGPSGVGKTTVARMIANNANMTMHKLNGTSASIADIKQIVAETETLSGINGILLYLDEIQYLNKKQQQSLLEYIENGKITLIASTTENPYFYVYNAVLSRSVVFEFKQIEPSEIEKALERGEIAEIAPYIEADVKTVIYGCLVYVPEHIPVEIPKELEILFECAQKEDISILCLDSDGEIVPELPTYEWSDSAVADITRKVDIIASTPLGNICATKAADLSYPGIYLYLKTNNEEKDVALLEYDDNSIKFHTWNEDGTDIAETTIIKKGDKNR